MIVTVREAEPGRRRGRMRERGGIERHEIEGGFFKGVL